MSDKPEILKNEKVREAAQDHSTGPETIRTTLARLRQLAKELPEVDAVAIVRDVREGAGQGIG